MLATRGLSSTRPALAVLLARLSGVAEEVLAVLRRSASSPNIKERADCSTALFTAERRAAGAVGVDPRAPRLDAGVGARPCVDALGRRLAPGEQAVVNDPYAGGTHLNDVTVVAPVHVDGDARRVGGEPGAPRRRRRRRARVDPRRRHRTSPRRACGCRRCA